MQRFSWRLIEVLLHGYLRAQGEASEADLESLCVPTVCFCMWAPKSHREGLGTSQGISKMLVSP